MRECAYVKDAEENCVGERMAAVHTCMCLCLHTHGIVHQLVQVFMKVGGGFLSEFGVHSDIWLHPCGLLEL